MRSRIAGRRALTVGGIYTSAILGFLGQVLAARWLGVEHYGLLAIVFSVTGFIQLLFDLTVEEAVVKYGFRYIAAEDWGKLRRLFRRALEFKLLGSMIASLGILAFAPFAHMIYGHGGLLVPLLISALIPIAQAPEGLAGNALLLRGRYDIRSFFLVVSMATRFTALVVGSRLGVTETVIFLVLAQVLTTALIGATGAAAFRRFPQASHASLGTDRAEIIRFMRQSAIASTVTTAQGFLAPLTLGVVANPTQVGLFRVSLAPQQALSALSSPVRLILLTEQTRDWERGDFRTVFRGVRRFTLVTSALMVVALPPLLVYMPQLVQFVYGKQYAGAGNASRFILVAAALSFVTGWSKSLPVSIGRPGLRALTHGVQALVLLPLVLVLGIRWHAAGATAAIAISTAVFVGMWAVLIMRIYRQSQGSGALATPGEEPA